MIDLTGCVSIPYLKKAVFTGSCGKMRYLLQKAEREDGGLVILVEHWKGPYASSATPKEARTFAEFPFDVKGLSQAIAWLNEEVEKYL